MLFSSLTFLYYFLPIVLLLYAITPKNLKNGLLLLSSLIFYAWGEPKYVIIMVITILIGYILGLLLEKTENVFLRKSCVTLAVIAGIGILVYFKYADFFIDSFNRVTGLSVPLLKVALPIGISFYTFQMLSYVIDVYRRDVAAQRSLIKLAAYIAMFPQLIAGPIVRYTEIAQQLDERSHTLEKISYGIKRFAIGMGKKVLLANTLGELVAAFESTTERTVLYVWIYVVAVTLQIYFDFSGYSDMAIGLGSILGFKFPENFNYPLISKTVTEFWRRWHMTLGGWFRDYIYIPMGGNRVSGVRWILNIAVVWMTTGLWHGASWNFVIWGIYFAIFLVLEKLVFKKYLDKIPILSHVYTLLLIVISFVIFHAETLPEAGTLLAEMFGLGKLAFISAESWFQLRNFAVLLVIGVVGATPLPAVIAKKIAEREGGRKAMCILEPLFIAVVFIVTTSYLVNGSFNPFLYFRF